MKNVLPNHKNNMPALTDISIRNNEQNLREDLQSLIIGHNTPHRTANELLQILRKHGNIELPSDVRVNTSRNLVNTSRNASVNMKCMGNGRYAHFGLVFALKRSIKIYSTFIKTNEIKININVDGLPISKSSTSQFWPIMTSIKYIGIHTSPFIIGVYHGMCKLSDANDFLTSFVNEFLLLSENGIIVCNKKYKVSINAILCDAPARSFITYTKGHAGYFSC